MNMDKNLASQKNENDNQPSPQNVQNPFEPATDGNEAQRLTEEDAALEQQKKDAMTERD